MESTEEKEVELEGKKKFEVVNVKDTSWGRKSRRMKMRRRRRGRWRTKEEVEEEELEEGKEVEEQGQI